MVMVMNMLVSVPMSVIPALTTSARVTMPPVKMTLYASSDGCVGNRIRPLPTTSR